MIKFKKVDKNLYSAHQSAIKNLYLKTFTTGISAQRITDQEAETYLNEMFEDAFAIFGFKNEKPIAAIISTPLDFDKQCPKAIKEKYLNKNTLYITEVLVDENFRGLGLGKKLMQEFENDLDENIKHVLLRVWDQNEAAVNLYKKSGYKNCGTLVQEKIRPITHEKFTMHKNYMLKSF